MENKRIKAIIEAKKKQQENLELLNMLDSMPADGQELILKKMEENEKIIEKSEELYEELISDNLIYLVRCVYKHTSDNTKRAKLIKEGKKKLKEVYKNFDYAGSCEDELAGVLNEFVSKHHLAG